MSSLVKKIYYPKNRKLKHDTNTFIKKAKKRHPSINYSITIYNGWTTPTDFRCLQHGNFKSTPGAFLQSKYGCRTCGKVKSTEASKRMGSKKTRSAEKKLIKNIEKKWPDKFSFHELGYKGQKYNVKIWCKKCNKFFTFIAGNLLKSEDGCTYCTQEKVEVLREATRKYIIKEDFIKKSIELYDNTLKYDKVPDKSILTDYIELYCSMHKCYFKTRVGNHIYSGKGCKDCRYDKTSVSNSSDLKHFIETANKIYNNNVKKFDYSLNKEDDYANQSSIVKIKCLTHNKIFEIKAINHLQGIVNCFECHNKVKCFNDFIEKSNKIHNNNVKKFDYSHIKEEDYANQSSIVKIKCLIHNKIFEIKAKDHLRRGGGNCESCQKYNKTELKIKERLIVEMNKPNSIIKKIIKNYRPEWAKFGKKYINRKGYCINTWSNYFYEYDFLVILKNKKKILIECDGPHHMEEVGYCKNKSLLKIQINDEIKNRLAYKYNHNLIRLVQHDIWNDTTDNWFYVLYKDILTINDDSKNTYHYIKGY